MIKAHAFVDDLAAPELAPPDRHHLERVLRLRPGDEVTVSDGRGSWRTCRFGPALEPVGEIVLDARDEPTLTVGFALVKGSKPELVVQKLTEVGIDRIVPFVGDRSVVRWDDAKQARAHERLAAVAREASMQSRRSRLPEILPVARFADLVATPGLALCERGGEPPRLERPGLLVGPEGGWSNEERAAAPHVALGPNVLRAETAAIVAGALLTALRARCVGSVPFTHHC